ncbi:MAG TPA: MlaD family protein [Steroidobacteraceae bacterium]|jgi:phospholipid/cholesterol/gamma-HCH transport system substrate-binding protein
MEREANYTAVGAFVLAIVLAAAGFVYWYSDSSEHREYHRYEIYFSGSVSGLDKGGAVRYLGVGVGRVVELHIDPRDSGRVEVIVDIGADTPISEHTVAQLQLQGVTGLLYIDLMDDRTGKHAAPAIAGLKYPVIRSSPSKFDVFLSSLPELVADAGEVVRRANQLFSDANLNAIAGALAGIETAARGLPQTARDLSALVVELRGATAELDAAAKGANTLIGNTSPDIEAATQRLHVIADHLADASGQIDGLLHDNRADIRAFAREGLPELQRFLREGRAAAEDIRALANSLREDPAQLLYEPPQRGLEIPR